MLCSDYSGLARKNIETCFLNNIEIGGDIHFPVRYKSKDKQYVLDDPEYTFVH